MAEVIAKHEVTIKIDFELTKGEFGGVPSYVSSVTASLPGDSSNLAGSEHTVPLDLFVTSAAQHTTEAKQPNNTDRQAEHWQWLAVHQLRKHLPAVANAAAEIAITGAERKELRREMSATLARPYISKVSSLLRKIGDVSTKLGRKRITVVIPDITNAIQRSPEPAAVTLPDAAKRLGISPASLKRVIVSNGKDWDGLKASALQALEDVERASKQAKALLASSK